VVRCFKDTKHVLNIGVSPFTYSGLMCRLCIHVNKYPTRCNYTQLILSVNCSTCFGWFLHPSSGTQITVSTASDTGQLLLLPVTIVEERKVATTVD